MGRSTQRRRWALRLVASVVITGALIYANTCLDFEGSIVDVAYPIGQQADGTYCYAKTTSNGCIA